MDKKNIVVIVVLALLLILWGVMGVMMSGVHGDEDDSKASVVEYHDDYRKACAKAYIQNKPVLIKFSASWCTPCKRVSDQMKQPKIAKLLKEKFIVLHMDIEGKYKDWCKKNFPDINNGIPFMCVVNTRTKKVIKKMSGYNRNPDYLFNTLSKIKVVHDSP